MSKADQVAQAAAEEGTAGEVVPVEKGRLLDVLTGKTALEQIKPTRAEITQRIVAEMLLAQTEEELWQEVPTWSSKSSVGEVFEIGDVRGVYESRFEDSETGEKGWFVCFDVVRLLTGEIGVLTSSSARICGRVGWYYDHGQLPQRFEIVSRGQSAAGFDLLDVAPPA